MSVEFQYEVFLSHSGKDGTVVRDVASQLLQDGVRVWLEEEQINITGSIPSKVEAGLEHSHVLVICRPANALGSDWAQPEAATFRFSERPNKERVGIPLQVDKNDPVTGK
jgi:hypothetical protein